jgi:hypothetical protein
VNSDALNLGLFYQIVACLITFLDGWMVGFVAVMSILKLVGSS